MRKPMEPIWTFTPSPPTLNIMTDPTKLTADDWIADLDASDAEIEAGLFVEGEVVLDKIRAALKRMEARRSAPPQRGNIRSR